MKRLLVFLAMTGAAASMAQAQIISVQFQGAGTAIPLDTVAGVVPADNFNVLTGSSFSSASLNDNTGTGTSATLSGSALGTYHAGSGFAGGTGDSDLLSGELYDSATGAGDTNSITVLAVPYLTYDVYVYGASDSAGRIGTFALTSGGSTSYLSLTAENNESTYTPGSSTYIGSGTPPSGIPVANYVEFTGLTSSSFTLAFGGADSTGASQHGAENGFQIVAVTTTPEPSTYAMLGIGLLALVVLQRSKLRA